MSNADKVADACRNAAAMMNPDLYWWDQFWGAAGIAAVVLVIAMVIALMAYTVERA